MDKELNEQLNNFVRYKDQLDKGQFLSDYIKCLVSYALRDIYDPIFKGKVELIVKDQIKELDS